MTATDSNPVSMLTISIWKLLLNAKSALVSFASLASKRESSKGDHLTKEMVAE